MRIDEIIQQPGQKERAMKNDIMKSIHVAIPGEVISYDEDKRTAIIQPTIREWNCKENPPVLTDVPVFMWGNYLFTPVAGDRCLVVCADSCIDSWVQNGGVSSPVVSRSHSLSDGFAFVGFNPTGGQPIPGGGGGGEVGTLIRTYTVTNTSGSYSHTFSDVAIVETMKPVLIECSNYDAFGADVDVTPGDQEITIECASLSGSSTITITLIGGPESLSPSQYEIIMDKIGWLSVVDGKVCITYETE